MVALVLTALLSAKAPAVGLSVAVSVKLQPTREQDALAQLSQGLAEAGLPTVRLDAKRCKGDEACLVKLAKDKSLDGAIFATLAARGREVAVDLDSRRISDGASIAQLTFTIGSVLDDARRQRLKAFAGQVLANLPVVEEPPKEDVPRAEKTPELTPPPKEEPPAIVAPEEEPSRTVPLALGGAAILAGGGAAYFAVMGNALQAEANANTDGRSDLTRAEAQERINRANANYTIAAGLGAVGGALLTGAIIAWASAE